MANSYLEILGCHLLSEAHLVKTKYEDVIVEATTVDNNQEHCVYASVPLRSILSLDAVLNEHIPPCCNAPDAQSTTSKSDTTVMKSTTQSLSELSSCTCLVLPIAVVSSSLTLDVPCPRMAAFTLSVILHAATPKYVVPSECSKARRLCTIYIPNKKELFLIC
eukprot:gene297-3669_t